MRTGAWLRTFYLLLLATAFGFYVLRCWRKRYVTLLSYGRSHRVERDSNPAWYWGVMAFYLLLEMYLCGELLWHSYHLIPPQAP